MRLELAKNIINLIPRLDPFRRGSRSSVNRREELVERSANDVSRATAWWRTVASAQVPRNKTLDDIRVDARYGLVSARKPASEVLSGLNILPNSRPGVASILETLKEWTDCVAKWTLFQTNANMRLSEEPFDHMLLPRSRADESSPRLCRVRQPTEALWVTNLEEKALCSA
jgi:hypothetical protein